MAARIDGGGGGRKADKIIRDALIAVARQQPEKVKKLAEMWWNKALDGDMMAADKLTDRIDGKAAQPISGDDENPLTIIQRIERVITDPSNKDS